MKFKGLAVTAALVMTMACMGASGGCGTTLHKAEATAAGIAATLNTAATTNHNNTLETPEERAAIAGYIDAAAKSNDTFIAVLGQAESNGGKVDVPVLLVAFQDLSSKIAAFQAGGVLHLKSPQAQAVFAVTISTLQAALAAIEADYPAATSTASGSKPKRHGPSPAPLMALALDISEIEELLALAIAAGSALVPKLLAMKEESGADLLTGAKADDATAEVTAEADIAAAGETPTGS